MDRPILLWIDFTRPSRQRAIPEGIEERCVLHRVPGPEDIDAKTCLIKPNVMCFEYDYPDHSGLMALVEIKRTHPSIPIIMLTEQTSESLAVWALRSRVWDYLVKPVTAEDIMHPVITLQNLRKDRSNGSRMVTPRNQLPYELQQFSPKGAERAVLKAKVYIERHLDQPLSESTVAEHCNISQSYFSRVFKQVCGVGFSEHVMRSRITKAMDLLAYSGDSVTGVAYDVGFQDPSYFSRVFKRYIGLTPSQYQEVYNKRNAELSTQPETRLPVRQ